MAVWTRGRRRPHRARPGRATPAASGPASRASRASGYGRTAGIAGITFTGLFTAALVFVSQAPSLVASNSSYTRFYTTGDHGALVTAGLYLLPFAGIAFLWFMSALRALQNELLGAAAPDIPTWLQLVSGALFIVLIFAGMASAGAIALLVNFSASPLPEPGVARALSAAGYGMVFVYGARVAGMYMITSTTLLRAAGVLPRWLAWLSYLAAAGVLVSWTFHPVFALIFPGWMLVVSVVMLAAFGRVRGRPAHVVEDGTPAPASAPASSSEEFQ
jgi:hypothetical protein